MNRIEDNLDNAIKMINHLAGKMNVQIATTTIEKPTQQQQQINDKKNSQEFNILNNRINTTLEQFTQLKDSINTLAKAIQESSTQTMETQPSTLNNDNAQQWS